MAYLQRAGVQLVDSPEEASVVIGPTEATAEEPALHACAQWLVGAWTAVEAIKRVAGVGSEAAAPTTPWTAEID
jgi:fructose-specific component phosphotransferase system IIB-like protein